MPDIHRSHVGKRLSQAAVHQGVLYLAGQVPSDISQDMAGQTRQVLASVDALLAEHGSDKSRILSCQIFLTDMSQVAAMNEVWDAWVIPGHTPPRATVGATLASPDKLIEVVIVAAAG
ncbi:RidA family protein [Cupriavidus consociatus]|uniref:RidA family protein n=1 Tax=Cupriavidus consociatus TaxID=2821357 RepID=UPI001AEA1913|nr:MULTISPECIES: RidA family protein [unclassified Cupriavidus]MBP0619248.1 RidA family protein [Cupriavidus sp. LEh25]MDK2655895.1 RidA family protein [Cupriavidus sp. LEh21]